MDEFHESSSPLVRDIRVFITHCSRNSTAVAPVNAPASWPSMDQTKPQPGSSFPKRKTKHRFVRLRALTAGGELAELYVSVSVSLPSAINGSCSTLADTCQHRKMSCFIAPVAEPMQAGRQQSRRGQRYPLPPAAVFRMPVWRRLLFIWQVARRAGAPFGRCLAALRQTAK
jgi:hypothetical protein